MDRPLGSGFAEERAVVFFDLIILARPVPTGKIFAVKDADKPLRIIVAAQEGVGLMGRDFADEEIPPADFIAVRLQLDRAFGEEGLRPVVVILQTGVIDDDLAIEPYARLVP